MLQEVATYKSDDSFAAMPTTPSGKIIDLLAVHNGWPIANADVTTAFMPAPERYLVLHQPGRWLDGAGGLPSTSTASEPGHKLGLSIHGHA